MEESYFRGHVGWLNVELDDVGGLLRSKQEIIKEVVSRINEEDSKFFISGNFTEILKIQKINKFYYSNEKDFKIIATRGV